MNRMEEIYCEAKRDKWLQRFAVFCRVALAASFLPSGFVKIMGERFASGLSPNHPLGHYFEALRLTGYYYPAGYSPGAEDHPAFSASACKSR